MNYNLIQNSKFKIQNSRKAFTLIEILVAIAIIGILAAVVLVSMSSYAKKARASKALAQLSSAIPSMVSCWGNASSSDYVVAPSVSGGGNICSISDSYGKWPKVGSGTDLSTYKLISTGSLIGKITNKSSWFVSLASGSSDDDKIVCCNSTMNGCSIVTSSCTAALTW